jgi:hypothetical protein
MRFSIISFKENLSGLAIASPGNKGFQHFPLVINSTPQIVCLANDLHKDLIEMPFPV